MNLWHALRHECAGAWRSMRYDFATHRAARLAGAFTEEFEPTGPPVPTPSRMVPLTGVSLLLAGGAAGAFLAISGGLAALDGTPEPPLGQQYAATAGAGEATATGAARPGAASPVAPRRAAAARPSPSPGPATLPAPAPPPVTEEGSTLPSASTSASPSPSASSPAPSASESSHGNTEGPRSRGHRSRR